MLSQYGAPTFFGAFHGFPIGIRLLHLLTRDHLLHVPFLYVICCSLCSIRLGNSGSSLFALCLHRVISDHLCDCCSQLLWGVLEKVLQHHAETIILQHLAVVFLIEVHGCHDCRRSTPNRCLSCAVTSMVNKDCALWEQRHVVCTLSEYTILLCVCLEVWVSESLKTQAAPSTENDSPGFCHLQCFHDSRCYFGGLSGLH
mmetsp:Transcript_113699/g.213007  ORF Transcript_113699/g.213007 Transcript_113699/m.213007 type:complete len:200 (-) Transcript_113699:913-1512(-)